jgi:hypothetical protein
MANLHSEISNNADSFNSILLNFLSIYSITVFRPHCQDKEPMGGSGFIGNAAATMAIPTNDESELQQLPR